jgi:hypothetical protein
MNFEISIAAKYLASVLVSLDARDSAASALERALTTRFANHFDLRNPLKGSGYRCLHVNNGVPEPLIALALAAAETKLDVSAAILRDELAVFCDPGFVSVKISGRESVLYNVEDVIGADQMSVGATSAPASPMRSQSQSPALESRSSSTGSNDKEAAAAVVTTVSNAPSSPPSSPKRELSPFAPVFVKPALAVSVSV